MGIMNRVSSALRLPNAPTTAEAASSDDRMRAHQQALLEKPAFQQVVIDLHDKVIELIDLYSSGGEFQPVLEIGSGVIPLKTRCPNALSSDIQGGDLIDVVVDATDISFADASFRAVVAQNVFHHLPSAGQAIPEMARVTTNSGVIVLIEPFHGRWARLIFPYLFPFEAFDRDASSETNYVHGSDGDIPNQAASYVVFVRDWGHLAHQFPMVEIAESFPLACGLRYLLTGGLNFRQVAPNGLLTLLRKVESNSLGERLLQKFAIHWVVILHVKTGSPVTLDVVP